MESQNFFPSSNRRVLIGSPTKQATTGRICVPIRMPLSGESVIAMPDWVGTAFEAVSKYLNEATPEVEQISDLTVAFLNSKPKNDTLFENPSARIPAAELRGFSVVRAGEAEDPDVELTFKLYAPFSRDFWKWLGEMAGAEVYMAFPRSLGQGVAVQPPTAKLIVDQEATEQEKEAIAGDNNPPADETPRKSRAVKSGPKELAKFHSEQGGKRGKVQPIQ